VSGVDFLRLPLIVRLLVSLFSLPTGAGGVGSSDGGEALVFIEVVRRWRVRELVDREDSGLLEDGPRRS
jgi:hypothetical protein